MIFISGARIDGIGIVVIGDGRGLGWNLNLHVVGVPSQIGILRRIMKVGSRIPCQACIGVVDGILLQAFPIMIIGNFRDERRGLRCRFRVRFRVRCRG